MADDDESSTRIDKYNVGKDKNLSYEVFYVQSTQYIQNPSTSQSHGIDRQLSPHLTKGVHAHCKLLTQTLKKDLPPKPCDDALQVCHIFEKSLFLIWYFNF